MDISEVTGADATAIQTGMPALDSGWTFRTFRKSNATTATDSSFFLRLNDDGITVIEFKREPERVSGR